ncbi:DUF2639 domain-containing protein [Rossellomorea sp. BNER]|uniref:DUF2639 domain-containing protein n=1 Tax=Rossellomorea sp. BNER TaxID=2962031 RepID=UPI003AF1F0F6|nr:YflJ family protein [Rossellomorea sp. BNER]
MVYPYSKGWFIKELKNAGITHHPVEKRKLENYKTHIIRSLWMEKVKNKQK